MLSTDGAAPVAARRSSLREQEPRPRETVVYGAGVTAPGARRWKAQLNENAKVPAFNGTLPEANHNEICAWEKPGQVAPQFAVFLEDPSQHPRVQARIELMARIVAEAGAGVERVSGRGETRLERLLSLVLLGDLVSLYLAVLVGRDPTPDGIIERLKHDLSREPLAA